MPAGASMAASWSSAVSLLLALLAGSAAAQELPALLPSAQCGTTPGAAAVPSGQYFDAVVQRCMPCSDAAPAATLPRTGVGTSRPSPGADVGTGACTCPGGFVQCVGGDRCYVNPNESFTAAGAFECRRCSSVNGAIAAPTEDRRYCLPCHVGPEPFTTLGYSTDRADCLCPGGYALVERGQDGAYLPAKICVRCADGLLPPIGDQASVARSCVPCPDPMRMERSHETGFCICRNGGRNIDSERFVAAGGACVSVAEFEEVNRHFPEASAVVATFRDLIDGRESYWYYGPFGLRLGIEERGGDVMEILGLNTGRASVVAVSSATIKWLYLRCAVGCLRGNATACQCISNLCALEMYDDDTTVCRFLVYNLYQGQASRAFSATGRSYKDRPWLYYRPQLPRQTLEDTSLRWKFTLMSDNGGRPDTTNKLKFWLAAYSLEGAWLGWELLESQLDLCARLSGASAAAQNPPGAWQRFGSSLITRCRVPLEALRRCGAEPVLYDPYLEDVDGTLVPVPVRILNTMEESRRPNLNVYREDAADDVLVRRFAMCDAVIGKEGGSEVYLDRKHLPRVFRFAAHIAVQVRSRPDSEGQVFVPVISIAYAEKLTSQVGGPSDTAPVSFKAEYAMDSEGFWTGMTVYLVFTIVGALGLAGYRIFVIERRYPGIPMIVPGGDITLFAPRIAVQVLALFSTLFTVFFWFHFSAALYWLITFKVQDVPHLLLPTSMEGFEYEPHDAWLVLQTCLGFISVTLAFYKHMKVFFFLVDWERVAALRDGERARSASVWPTAGYARDEGQQGFRALPSDASSPQMVGAPLLHGQQPAAFGTPVSMQGPGQTQQPAGFGGAVGAAPSDRQELGEAPDGGISAWRTLFVCNELNKRLGAQRTLPHLTWLAMVALLEGCNWKHAARWYPRGTEAEDEVLAQPNPFLQFALGAVTWMLVLAVQLIVSRIAVIFVSHDLTDFMDVCSVANVSVLLLDEPYHGYYLHGKAASGRGDWCHSDLSRVLHDEDKGIGLTRGLTADGCQTFELFLPPDLAVSVEGPGVLHFRREVCRVFGDVAATHLAIHGRRPEKATSSDVHRLSVCRCQLQAMVDALVHAVLQNVHDVVQSRSSLEWFWGAAPGSGVAAMRHPVFYKDTEGLAWCSCLAYGSEIRLLGVGIPTGFEAHLTLLEFMVFSITWRWHGSIYLGAALAYALNRLIIITYRLLGRVRLAHTAVIDGVFLLRGAIL